MVRSSGKVIIKIVLLFSFVCNKKSELHYRKLTWGNAEKLVQFLLYCTDHPPVSTFNKYILRVISGWSDKIIVLVLGTE